MKNKFFLNPDKRDTCVNEIIFCQKKKKIISNLLNGQRFPEALLRKSSIDRETDMIG